MLTINGSFILHEDDPSQEQMDANAFFVVHFLKETIISILKHDFDIFSNRTNKVTTILASEYQEELKGDYLISFCYSSHNDTKDYFEKLKNFLKDILESLEQDIENGYFNIVFDGFDEKDKKVHLEDLVQF